MAINMLFENCYIHMNCIWIVAIDSIDTYNKVTYV